MLLWEAKQHLKPSEEHWSPTETGAAAQVWKADVPAVFELVKTAGGMLNAHGPAVEYGGCTRQRRRDRPSVPIKEPVNP